MKMKCIMPPAGGAIARHSDSLVDSGLYLRSRIYLAVNGGQRLHSDEERYTRFFSFWSTWRRTRFSGAGRDILAGADHTDSRL